VSVQLTPKRLPSIAPWGSTLHDSVLHIKPCTALMNDNTGFKSRPDMAVECRDRAIPSHPGVDPWGSTCATAA
jgi:hypothetical protein